MKLIQYTAAYAALVTLSKKEFPYSLSYKLVKLRRTLAPKAEFYGAEEQKLAARFGKCDEDGRPIMNGAHFECRGDTPEEIAANAREFERLRRELGAVEDDEGFEKVSLDFPDDTRIAPEILEALEVFAVLGGGE